MPNALRDLHTSDAKDLAINLAMIAYGNRPNAMKFAFKQLRSVASTETFNGNQALVS